MSRVAKALELRAAGYTTKQIAAELGLSYSYASRLGPRYQASLRSTRAYKERQRRACIDCGKPTWMTSTHCFACHIRREIEDRKWTKEAVIDAIQRFAATHGRPPLAYEWITSDRENDYPARSSVYGHYGKRRPFKSWADAIEAAGYPRPHTGKKRDDTRPNASRAVLDALRSNGPMRYAELNRLYLANGATSHISNHLGWWIEHGYIERLERGLYRATDKRYKGES